MNCKEICKESQMPCLNKSCRHWIDFASDLNCTLVCVEENGCLTLKEVAKRLGVSHVRIKQIQDKALKKINKKIINDNIY
tara:strand:+ start:112 stop:351 length:240 start_codon:yes stop_codon:yes gene_type:complete